MQLLLVCCGLLALVAAKPRQVVGPDGPIKPDSDKPLNQWIAAEKPSHDSQKPESDLDDFFENRNPDVTDDGLELFESDMLLTEEQRDGRQASTNLWTSPVSFAISSTSAADRAAIEAGVQHWRDNTCIQFNEVAEGSSVPHIKVIKSSGCWSYIGKTSYASTGGQELSIGTGCTRLGTVVHEFGHAMGLSHQQSRHDRDNYVTIMSENILDGRENNFLKRSTANNYSVPYDLTSVMHYGNSYFTRNGLDTIVVNDFTRNDLIGRRGGMSQRDQQIANAMYNCAAGCSSPPTCQNGGFVSKACTCVCPPNTAGSNCETLNGDYYGDLDCGDTDITTEGTITSPNYPSNYPTNVKCWWVIKAPAGQKVKLTFTDSLLQGPSSSGCSYDYLGLRYTGDVHNNDQQACSSQLTGQSFTSTGSQFIVQLKSDSSQTAKGFSATVEFVTGQSTTTVSPSSVPPSNCARPARRPANRCPAGFWC